jgi:hypothetical protein
MLHELTGGVQAVEEGHPNVNDDNIGLELLGHFNRFTAVGSFAAYFPALTLLQERTQASAYNFVVVG